MATSDDLTEVELRELCALLSDVSDGPWQALAGKEVFSGWPVGIMSTGGDRDDGVAWGVATVGVRVSECSGRGGAQQDARFIAAIRNAAPRLLAELRRVREFPR